MLGTIEQIQIYSEEYTWETAVDPKIYPLLFDLIDTHINSSFKMIY